MEQSKTKIAVLSFYSFIDIPEPDLLVPKILLIGKKKYIRGTILLAKEGFNGSISGSEENLHLLIHEIKKLTSATDVSVKVNYCNEHPFSKLKIKLKSEIVAMSVQDLDVNGLKGEYIDSKDWDEFIQRQDVVLIDTRNKYEVEIGTFEGAVDPKTNTFKEFPAWVENNKNLLEGKKIAMCCTGGIRCEKSTAYLKFLGFKEVYHLNGGILQYLEDTQNQNKMWKGECFVFDDRRAVDDFLAPAFIRPVGKIPSDNKMQGAMKLKNQNVLKVDLGNGSY
jgi:UPF0176 protein